MIGKVDPKRYGRMLSRLIPRPPQNDEEHDTMVAELIRLDDLDNPTPEQKAVAELLTALVEHYENNMSRCQSFRRTNRYLH